MVLLGFYYKENPKKLKLNGSYKIDNIDEKMFNSEAGKANPCPHIDQWFYLSSTTFNPSHASLGCY